MSLRLKPVSFSVRYYSDETRKGTVMVADRPKPPGWEPPKGYEERLCDILEGEDVEVLDEAVVRGSKDVIRLRETMEPDVDLIVTAGTSSWLLMGRVADLGFPVLLFGGGGHVKGFLESGGWKVYTPYGAEELKTTVRALGVKKKLWDTDAVLFGEMPSFSVLDNIWDFELVRCRFGVGCRQVENRELLERQEAVSREEAKKVLNSWMKQVEDVVEPSEEELLEVAKLYIAMRELLEENGASALAINCGRLTEKRFVTPCWAMARLIDEGISCACEGDINAMLTMTALMHLSKGAAMMGNFNVRPQEGTVTVSHDVIPSKMTKTPYSLFHFHYRGKGVTAYAELKGGEPVTIAGLRRDLKQMFVTVGETLWSKNTVHCRITVGVRVQNPEAIRKAMCAHHYTMVYGDYSRELEKLGEILGIEVLKV